MASINLSANGPSISKSYQSVVDSSISEPAKDSSTFAKWALFSVSTPLMSAFQQDAGNKESVLKVQDTGEGDLENLIDEFSEGKVQFAFVKVLDANTGLPKNVLIAWCGEGVPERTKGYFTSHLSTVSKFLHGYHVQITARSETDLTVEGIIQKVGDASGAKYTRGLDKPVASVPKPPISSKPAFTPLRTGGISAGARGGVPLPIREKSNDDDNGWGPDAPPVTRTNLEKVQPAYQPTRVNIQELKSAKQPESNSTGATGGLIPEQEDVVRGGYQPVGKVDIAAIRRRAREDGNLKDDRPEPVKGAYEPVGKVDIAAIRARAQKTDESTPTPQEASVFNEPPAMAADSDLNRSSRLTSLPKPKVSNKFGGSSAFTGTKPPLPGGNVSSATPTPPVGSASRTFADQGGKTPAQLWAEKKAKERGQEPAVTSPGTPASPTVHAQHSGGSQWKSSYTGKTWAPVQTTHTGQSAASSRNDAAGSALVDSPTPDPATPQQSVSSMREQFTQSPPKEASTFPQADEVDTLLESGSRDAEGPGPQAPAPQYQPPRSPTPDFSERESSPILVAVPIAREALDSKEEQLTPTIGERPEDLQQGLSNDEEGLSRATIASSALEGATPAGDADSSQIRAVVQYDYEKAEDNEVDLKEGEYVTEIEMVDKDWWLGLNARGERGLFPSNYVEVVGEGSESPLEYEAHPTATTDVPENAPATTTNLGANGKPTAKALYDYEAAEDNELTFPEGAEITNIEFPDDDWWLGDYHGKTGLFPANYVQLDD
ncbi:putative actin binding protein [Aspergillus stella-maris]|uniref:putative actin binding protein n=1 Tax=Aspergillus stella-maris TaxID=1810926 RepID=UPI003CCDCE3B